MESAAAAARGRNVRSLSPPRSSRAGVTIYRFPPARDRYPYSNCRPPRLGAIREGVARPPPPPPQARRGCRSDCRSPAFEEKGEVKSLSPQPRGHRSEFRSPPANAKEVGAARSLSPQPRDHRSDCRSPPLDAKGEGATGSRSPPPSRENAVVAAGAIKCDTTGTPALELKPEEVQVGKHWLLLEAHT